MYYFILNCASNFATKFLKGFQSPFFLQEQGITEAGLKPRKK